MLEEDPHNASVNIMLQGLTRFLLDRFAQDYKPLAPNPAAMEQVRRPDGNPASHRMNANMWQMLTTHATSSIKCMNCRSEYTRPAATFVNDLMYPSLVSPVLAWRHPSDSLTREQKAPGRSAKSPRITFSQVLKHSIERETTSKGWCSRCQRYQTIATRKTVHNIPAVLMLNTAITNQEHKMLWATPGWLPEEIGIIVEQGQFFCYEGEDLKLHLQRGMHNITVYSLIGSAVNIENGQAQKPHLVSIINGTDPHVFYGE